MESIENQAKAFLRKNSLRYIEAKEIETALGITDTNSSEYEELYRFLGILQKDFVSKCVSSEYFKGFRATSSKSGAWAYYYFDYEYLLSFQKRVRTFIKQTPDKRFSQNDLVSALKISSDSDKFYLKRSMLTTNVSKGFKAEYKYDRWYCYYEMPEEERRKEEFARKKREREIKEAVQRKMNAEWIEKMTRPSQDILELSIEMESKVKEILKRIDELSAKIERSDAERESTHEKHNNKEGFVESRYVLYMVLFFAVVFACIHFFDMNAILKIVQMFKGNN